MQGDFGQIEHIFASYGVRTSQNRAHLFRCTMLNVLSFSFPLADADWSFAGVGSHQIADEVSRRTHACAVSCSPAHPARLVTLFAVPGRVPSSI